MRGKSHSPQGSRACLLHQGSRSGGARGSSASVDGAMCRLDHSDGKDCDAACCEACGARSRATRGKQTERECVTSVWLGAIPAPWKVERGLRDAAVGAASLSSSRMQLPNDAPCMSRSSPPGCVPFRGTFLNQKLRGRGLTIDLLARNSPWARSGLWSVLLGLSFVLLCSAFRPRPQIRNRKTPPRGHSDEGGPPPPSPHDLPEEPHDLPEEPHDPPEELQGLQEVQCHRKIFWVGVHDTIRDLEGRPLASTISWAGLASDVLARHGFTQVPTDTSLVPIFSYTGRKGGQFPVGCTPLLRQFPPACVDVLDDKRQLWEAVSRAGLQSMMPPSFVELSLVLDHHSPDHSLNQSPEPSSDACSDDPSPACSPAPGVSPGHAPGPEPLFFLKHCRGANGKSVEPHTLDSLRHEIKRRGWNQASSPSSLAALPREYIIQREVYPPMLRKGRKFVIRVHVLITRKAGDAPARRTRVFAHRRSALLVWHEKEYDPRCMSKAVHVSSNSVSKKGSKLPPECLHHDEALFTASWPQICSIAAGTIQSSGLGAPPDSAGGPETHFYHLLGFDVMLDSQGRCFLLEVNTFPAFGTGPVLGKSKEQYASLADDLLSALVAPITSPQSPDPCQCARNEEQNAHWPGVLMQQYHWDECAS